MRTGTDEGERMPNRTSSFELVILVAIFALVVVSTNLHLGTVSAVLLRILSVPLDIHNSLAIPTGRKSLKP